VEIGTALNLGVEGTRPGRLAETVGFFIHSEDEGAARPESRAPIPPAGEASDR
jgi:hypothetical protein